MLKLIITGKDFSDLKKNIIEAAAGVGQSAAKIIAKSAAEKEADDSDAEESVHEIDVSAARKELYKSDVPKKRGRPAGSKNGEVKNGGTKTADLTDRPAEVSSTFEEVSRAFEESKTPSEIKCPTKEDALKALRAVNLKHGFGKAKEIMGKYSSKMHIDDVPVAKYQRFIEDCAAAQGN